MTVRQQVAKLHEQRVAQVTGEQAKILQIRQQTIGGYIRDGFTPASAIAAAVMGLPLMVRTIRLSIEAIDRRLEQAAETLGAAPWKVFFTVTLPLALPGVLAGMVLGFAKAIGEFGATITFVSNIPGETQTISSAIYSLIQTPDGDAAAAWMALLDLLPLPLDSPVQTNEVGRLATLTPWFATLGPGPLALLVHQHLEALLVDP